MHTVQSSIHLADTDAAGVIFFARLQELAHRVYEDWLEQHGCGLRALFDEGERGLPIVHAECDYRAPLRVGDPIRITMTVPRIGTSSYQTAFTIEGEDGVTAGKVLLIHACRYADGRGKAPLPAALLAALQGLHEAG